MKEGERQPREYMSICRGAKSARARFDMRACVTQALLKRWSYSRKKSRAFYIYNVSAGFSAKCRESLKLDCDDGRWGCRMYRHVLLMHSVRKGVRSISRLL